MAAQYDHIFVNELAKPEKFTSLGAMGKLNLFSRDRVSHSQKLLAELDSLWKQNEELHSSREAVSLPTREGTYLEFTSGANADLITKSLEDSRKGIRLLNVRIDKSQDSEIVKATVYIPNGQESVFIKKIQEYSNSSKDSVKGNPKNANLVNSIESVCLAILESFWPQEEVNKIPNDTPQWCEVWLKIDDKYNFDSQVSNFLGLLDQHQIRYKGNALSFPERAVLLIWANRQMLNLLVVESDQLAEFRIGQELASYWIDESNIGQTQWAKDLLQRLEVVDTNVTVCILDSGVNNGHILLHPILDDNNCLTVDPLWGTNDESEISRRGHGTLMAGLIAYGNLQKELESQNTAILTHKLCSVKILPKHGQSPTEHWGSITDQAVSRAEIQNSEQVLLFCMAVTSNVDVDKGRPSSWSGAIDQICFAKGENPKLFIISGGNVTDREIWKIYPEGNRLFSVQNPAQAWNALTIGAFTEKIRIEDHIYDKYNRLAPVGGLSPFSSSSSLWENKWPIKPEVLFEGGNLIQIDPNTIDYHTDLELLTTAKNFSFHQFDTINATSAASAQASWLAAKLAYKYPNIWPETIRALIVHSANWPQALLDQFGIRRTSKTDIKDLLRIAGYGVPNIKRTLFSYENGLTFVAQEIIQPFIKENGEYKTNEMHLFDFPWPKELLLSLGAIQVKLRITLSYFIDPSPGAIGWKDKYRYQSHGLRFDLNNVGETEKQFRARINKAAREEDAEKETEAGSARWVIGKKGRDVGSIHSDIWEGNAADIADCNLIAIYPIIGWWRERHNQNKFNSKCRYSLVVSLDTPSEEIPLYSTIATKISIPIEIKTDI